MVQELKFTAKLFIIYAFVEIIYIIIMFSLNKFSYGKEFFYLTTFVYLIFFTIYSRLLTSRINNAGIMDSEQVKEYNRNHFKLVALTFISLLLLVINAFLFAYNSQN